MTVSKNPEPRQADAIMDYLRYWGGHPECHTIVRNKISNIEDQLDEARLQLPLFVHKSLDERHQFLMFFEDFVNQIAEVEKQGYEIAHQTYTDPYEESDLVANAKIHIANEKKRLEEMQQMVTCPCCKRVMDIQHPVQEISDTGEQA